MFESSLPEFVLLFVIGLLVLGPQRLPKVAAEIGKWVGRARRTAAQLRRQLEREIELAELQANNPPPSPPPANTTETAPTLSPSGVAESAPPPTAEPATTRQISDAISEHAAAPAPTAVNPPQESPDKPPPV